jgi:wyosine [tRNA(Phe)-imidazoG37] synthetase (radical SAM superfamily)
VAEREAFQSVDVIVEAVAAKVEAARDAGEWIDYLTFVPDGEPTLDEALGRLIESLHPLGIPIAVVTNGSLLHHAAVREALALADLVSIKVDGVDEATWRRVNRPHGRLELPLVLEGMRVFAAGFEGRLVTETMLMDGLNDGEPLLRATASFVAELEPAVAYLAVPTRPPAESWVRAATPTALTRAYEVFRALVGRVELLVDYEGDAFTPTGDPREALLGITAVHPMRKGAVIRLLARAGAAVSLLPELVERGELVEVSYAGHHYYLRPLRMPKAQREA